MRSTAVKAESLTASFGPRMAEVERIAAQAMAQNDAYPDRPANYILAHGRRVAYIALDLADELGAEVNPEILYTGTLFHDVGKARVEKNEAADDVEIPDTHVSADAAPHELVGAERAAELLAHLFTYSELLRIHDIVLHHNHRAPPNNHTVAAKIAQDADSLDHVGMVGAWLTVYHTAREGGTLQDALEYAKSEAQVQDREEMRRQLNFGAARRRFDARVAREEAYYRALRELDGGC